MLSKSIMGHYNNSGSVKKTTRYFQIAKLFLTDSNIPTHSWFLVYTLLSEIESLFLASKIMIFFVNFQAMLT